MSALFTAGSPVSWPMVYTQQVFFNEQMNEGVDPQLEVQKVMLPARMAWQSQCIKLQVLGSYRSGFESICYLRTLDILFKLSDLISSSVERESEEHSLYSFCLD